MIDVAADWTGRGLNEVAAVKSDFLNPAADDLAALGQEGGGGGGWLLGVGTGGGGWFTGPPPDTLQSIDKWRQFKGRSV